jgi:hypothetical protein
MHCLWGNSPFMFISEKIEEISGIYIDGMQANNLAAGTSQTDKLCS